MRVVACVWNYSCSCSSLFQPSPPVVDGNNYKLNSGNKELTKHYRIIHIVLWRNSPSSMNESGCGEGILFSLFY